MDHPPLAVSAIDSIALLDEALIPENASLLAAAMEVDPAYRYLFPCAEQRTTGLRAFFAGNQRIYVPHRCIHVARGMDGTLCGTVTLRPPGGIPISALVMLRHGLLPFALRHGLDAVRRLVWLKDTYEALERDASRGEPHLYLHMMAVEPTRQGRGVGSQLLAHVLEHGQREHGGVRCVLTTHLPQNVIFYRRAGFEVTDERVLEPKGSESYTVWSMTREA